MSLYEPKPEPVSNRLLLCIILKLVCDADVLYALFTLPGSVGAVGSPPTARHRPVLAVSAVVAFLAQSKLECIV